MTREAGIYIRGRGRSVGESVLLAEGKVSYVFFNMFIRSLAAVAVSLSVALAHPSNHGIKFSWDDTKYLYVREHLLTTQSG